MREIKERYKGGAPSPSEGKPSERGKESEEVILVNKQEWEDMAARKRRFYREAMEEVVWIHIKDT